MEYFLQHKAKSRNEKAGEYSCDVCPKVSIAILQFSSVN